MFNTQERQAAAAHQHSAPAQSGAADAAALALDSLSTPPPLALALRSRLEVSEVLKVHREIRGKNGVDHQLPDELHVLARERI